MNQNFKNGQNGVATSADIEKFGKIEIRDCDGKLQYHNYSTWKNLRTLAMNAIYKFTSNGWKVETIDENRYWRLTDQNSKWCDLYIEIDWLEWFGIESECDDICTVYDEFTEED